MTLPIESGRWSRISRENRLCPRCNILGDEHHCSEISRNPSHNFTENLSEIWKNKNIFELFKELENSEYLKVYYNQFKYSALIQKPIKHYHSTLYNIDEIGAYNL